MINYIQNGKITIMDIKERDNLSAIGNAYDYKENPTDNDKQEYYDSFIQFIDFVISYCNKELKGKQYSDNHIIQHVFITEFKSEQIYKQYLRYSLYCAKLYVEFLKKYLKKKYVRRYKTLRLNLLSDIEWLIASYEVFNKQVKNEIHPTCGSNHEISSKDMLWVLKELTIIDNAPDIKNIDLRDIQPYRMFVIRQLLETTGRNLIGYESINDKKGNPIHKFTQVSWEFLKKYSNDKNKQWNLKLPFEISSIYKINNWSNSFVHSGYIYASYIQFYAVDFLIRLMASPSKPVKCFDGKYHVSTLYGDFRIEGYDFLKTDFEQYIALKYKGSRQSVQTPTIIWMQEDKVGAYIISR